MVESLQEKYLNNQLSEIDEKLFMIYEALDQASLDNVSEILDKLEELPKGIEAVDQAIEKVGSNLNYLLGKVGKDAEKRLPQAIGEVTSLATILSTGFKQLPQIVKLNLRIKDLNQFPDGKSIDQVIQSKTNAKEIRNNFENQLKKAFTGQAKTGWGKFTASVGAFFKGKADRLKFYEKPGGLDYDKLISGIMSSTFKVVGDFYEMVKVLDEAPVSDAGSDSETSEKPSPEKGTTPAKGGTRPPSEKPAATDKKPISGKPTSTGTPAKPAGTKVATTGGSSAKESGPNPEDLSSSYNKVIDKIVDKNPKLGDLTDDRIFQANFDVEFDDVKKVISGLDKLGLLKLENFIRQELRKRVIQENLRKNYRS